MHHLIFRSVILLVFFVFSGTGSISLAGSTNTGNEKKYMVTFGESNHNYLPGSLLRIGLTFKSTSADDVHVSQEFEIVDSAGVKVWDTVINLDLRTGALTAVPFMVAVPNLSGIYTFTLSASQDSTDITIPSFQFSVIQPKKSPRLSKILVHTPDSEEGLNRFLKLWDIKAPTISWGQVLLLGKKSWMQYVGGDQQIAQLIDRALKREMSVIFLDIAPTDNNEDQLKKIALPYGVSMSFTKAREPEQKFVLKSDYKELIFDLQSREMQHWNGFYGVTVPATDLKFEGKDVKINAYATTSQNPYRFPLVELVPKNGKGKIFLSQILTEGRLDEGIKSLRGQPQLPAYDPMAVQFLLNLISQTVDDKLLK
jgi:hypothetical protein